MRNPLPGKIKSGESRKIHWKRRPSEIRGYTRTLYLNTDTGDYIRVDYNTKEKKVRLYVEDSEEGGIPYYSVISNGKITAERNAQTGRPHDLSDKFGQRSEIFSTIGNREVLKLINKNYGINQDKKQSERRDNERKMVLERTRQRYFKPDEYGGAGGGRRSLLRFRLSLVDVIDIAIGTLLTASLYLYEYDFVSSGILAAFYGIIIGTVDIFLRGRDPFFPKVVGFIIAGVGLYVYGYYYR
jgi:hypothetical protein